MGLGRFQTLVRGPLGINGSLVLAKYCSLCGCFVNRLLFLETHPPISLEWLWMLISEICTLTHTRMGLGSVIFPSKGPMRGQYGFFIAKFSNVYGHFLF